MWYLSGLHPNVSFRCCVMFSSSRDTLGSHVIWLISQKAASWQMQLLWVSLSSKSGGYHAAPKQVLMQMPDLTSLGRGFVQHCFKPTICWNPILALLPWNHALWGKKAFISEPVNVLKFSVPHMCSFCVSNVYPILLWWKQLVPILFVACKDLEWIIRIS